MKKILRNISLISAVVFVSVVLINVIIVKESENQIYDNIADIPEKQAVIVLGAYVRGETLSPVLRDRVVSGVEIYSANKASKVLLSGDHGRTNYDEVNGMRKYIIATNSNFKVEDIFMDHAGFDTYDTMYRAKEIFGVESAIIVTQEFHINRAVYIAKQLGIDAVGYSVSEAKYPESVRLKWQIREYLSRVKAFGDIILKSKPKYLGEKIPITGDGRLSWDEDK